MRYFERMGNKKKSIESIEAALKNGKLRVTEQRVNILSILHKEHGPFSCEEIFQRMPKNSCDLATVYRSLEQLEESGLVNVCNFQDGLKRYEIEGGHHHHHFVCRSCKAVEPLEDCVVASLEKKLEKKGYKNLKHHLEVFGLCPKCA